MRRKYNNKEKNLKQNFILNEVLKEFIEFEKRKVFSKVVNYFTDTTTDNLFIINIRFIKYFFLNKPKYIYINSDWHFVKEQYISLGMIFVLKIFHNDIKFIGHSPDPHFVLNKIRLNICKIIFDAQTEMPFMFFKKTEKKIIFPDLGLLRKNFTNPIRKRDIDILFIGRVKGFNQRENYINYLEKFFKVHKFGVDFNNFVYTNTLCNF